MLQKQRKFLAKFMAVLIIVTTINANSPEFLYAATVRVASWVNIDLENFNVTAQLYGLNVGANLYGRDLLHIEDAMLGTLHFECEQEPVYVISYNAVDWEIIGYGGVGNIAYLNGKYYQATPDLKGLIRTDLESNFEIAKDLFDGSISVSASNEILRIDYWQNGQKVAISQDGDTWQIITENLPENVRAHNIFTLQNNRLIAVAVVNQTLKIYSATAFRNSIDWQEIPSLQISGIPSVIAAFNGTTLTLTFWDRVAQMWAEIATSDFINWNYDIPKNPTLQAGTTWNANFGLSPKTWTEWDENNSPTIYIEYEQDGVRKTEPANFYFRSELSPVVITSTNLPTGLPQIAYSFQLEAESELPLTWSYVGALPYGLTLDSQGLLFGTPTSPGRYIFNVTACNGKAPSVERRFILDILEPALQISTAFTDPGGTVDITFNVEQNPGFTSMMLKVNIPTGLNLTNYESLMGGIFFGIDIAFANEKRYFYTGWMASDLVGNGRVLSLTFETAQDSNGFLPVTASFENAFGRDLPLNFAGDEIDFKISEGGVNVQPKLVGDITGDGQITSADVNMLARWMVGQNVSIDSRATDVNCDGFVTTADITHIARYIVGHFENLCPNVGCLRCNVP